MATQTDSKPTGLGDSSSAQYSLARHEVPLPGSRKEIVIAFESIVSKGGVQKVVVELGKPIQYYQLVSSGPNLPPEELLPDDIWLQIRNNEIVNVEAGTSVNSTSLALLFSGCAYLTESNLKPLKIFCHDSTQLRDWLGLGPLADIDYVLGIETASHPDVPDDVIILAGISWDEDPSTTIGVRLPVDLPRLAT
jgi:hypothetical protein